MPNPLGLSGSFEKSCTFLLLNFFQLTARRSDHLVHLLQFLEGWRQFRHLWIRVHVHTSEGHISLRVYEILAWVVPFSALERSSRGVSEDLVEMLWGEHFETQEA